MPVVVSFDVGIKNMAYCILGDGSILTPETPKILGWGLLNLTPTSTTATTPEVVVPLCCKCSKKSVYWIPCLVRGQRPTQGLCLRHAKSQSVYIVPEKKHCISAMKTAPKLALMTMYQKYCGSEMTGALTKAVLMDKLAAIFQEKHLIPVMDPKTRPTLGCHQLDLIQIARTMSQRLQILGLADLGQGLTDVIIENQISPIATRMKTIQGFLTEYFVLQHPTVSIEYICAGNKLKDLRREHPVPVPVPVVPVVSTPTPTSTQEEGATRKPNSYKQNKSDAIFYTNLLLESQTSPEWKILFQGAGSKRDDLADCFLQGIWWWRRQQRRVETPHDE